MVIIDANVVLRIILDDNKDMVEKSRSLIRENKVLIRNEVLAEIIYVLLKVYRIDKEVICKWVLAFSAVDNICYETEEVIVHAVHAFQDNKIDFVDCLLYAYKKVENYSVFTFDKKLNRLLNN